MKPWVVDAKDIEPEDLDQFSGQLLHLNNQIADFLDPATTEEVLIIAPKGFGKTLLLKAKRQSMRERYRTMLPERALVDKPSANPDLMSLREYATVRETEAYWKALWSIALTLAVEKHLGACPELSGPLDKMVKNEHLRSACDLFTNLLALSRDAYFAAFKDYVAHLLPAFRGSTARLPYSSTTSTSISRISSPAIWSTPRSNARSIAATGTSRRSASRSRRATCMRSTITSRSSSRSARSVPAHFLGNPLGRLQLAGSALDLQYAREDLIEIIRKNIEVERKRSLVDQQARDPWVRFFGQRATRIVHQNTGDEEDVVAFLDPPYLPPAARHRVHRPRPRDNRPEPAYPRTIRQQITRSAAAIAQGFITGVAPHLPQFDREILFRLIPRNVLARAKLEASASSTTGCSRSSRAPASRSPCPCSPACSRSGCSATSASTRKPPSWSSISAIRARCRSTATTSCRGRSSS